MEIKRRKQSFIFSSPPTICAFASAAGKKEGQGPLREYFDLVCQDTKLGEKTWEKAETRLQVLTLQTLLNKAAMTESQVDVLFSGDLLNQCIGSNFALRSKGIPMVGLYGACSTMAEGLLLAAASVSAGFSANAVALTSSHFAASERQYRFPLGYGGQRPPTAQRTVTGCGAVLLGQTQQGIKITCGTVGTVIDKGIKDANNMGAAMAPAAFSTLRAHFDDMHRAPDDYDLIVTGDLGALGSQIVAELFEKDGVKLDHYNDCGVMIFDSKRQDVHCGGSGCGCSASVLCGYLLRRMHAGTLRKLLFCGTGALLSPCSCQQGESIPAICHAVAIEQEDVSWII